MTILDDLKKFTDKRPILKNPTISLTFNIIFAVLGIMSLLYGQTYSLYSALLGIFVLLLVYVEKPQFRRKDKPNTSEGHNQVKGHSTD